MRGLSSIFWRTLLATAAAGALTVAIALAFMARAMSTSAEAGLVDFAVDGTERTRESIGDRLAEVDAELSAATWAFRAERAFEVPTLLPPHVVAARVEGAGEALQVERVEGALGRLDAALAEGRGAGIHVADETTLLVVRADDDVQVVALVSVASLLDAGEGVSMWLGSDVDDARLRDID